MEDRSSWTLRAPIAVLVWCGCSDTSSTATNVGATSSSDPETSASHVDTSTDGSTVTSADVDTSTDDSSSADSSSSACGDAVLDPGELCDDGNDIEDDACTSLCLPPECGDGILQRALGETCDDGNDDNFDPCPNDCLGTTCGDGVAEGTEACDHGGDNGNGFSMCTAECALNVCGDGYLVGLAGEECDEGASTGDGTSACSPTCRRNVCGDGYLSATANELCDDGDDNGVGLCSRNCTDWLVTSGAQHTCARSPAGNVQCWGNGQVGALGYASTEHVGDDETPAEQGDVDIGGIVVDIDAGFSHTCAVLEGGAVRCWGRDHYGQLGYVDGENAIGDDEAPASAGDVDLGGEARQIACGIHQTCALMHDGTVRCWGRGATGTPGYGGFIDGEIVAIGIDLPPSAPEALVDLGGEAAVQLVAADHTCAVMESGDVRCWGDEDDGWFGYGMPVGVIGDDESPGSLPPLPIGAPVRDVMPMSGALCVRFSTGDVRCVGEGQFGLNGAGSGLVLGDDEAFAVVPDVVLGIQAAKLRGSGTTMCAIGGDGNARCWGIRTGYEADVIIGDDETPADVGDLPIDEPVVEVTGGSSMMCVLTADGGIRCWGTSVYGELGYGNQASQMIAAAATDVPFE